MVRVMVLLALLAGPVGAKCFGPLLPQILRFEDGPVMRILSHAGRDITFRTLSPEGGFVVNSMRDGLFPRVQSANGVTTGFEWLTNLPDIATLTPGFAGKFEADVMVEQAFRLSYVVNVKVLRTDQVIIAGCTYRVIVIQRDDRANGQKLARLVLWLSPDLHLALRNETTQDGVTTVRAVIGME